jgi:hypothetical protein
MPILVVCTGCQKRFQVSDKFAGKSGPCPTCKRLIQVPDASPEVQAKPPTEIVLGDKTPSWDESIRSVPRTHARLSPKIAVAVVAASFGICIGAWWGGNLGLFDSYWLTTVGLLLVSVPLTLAGYIVLQNDEFEVYQGKPLYIRAALCAIAYAVLWGFFSVLLARGIMGADTWIWLFIIPPFFVIGGLVAQAAFDLEFGDAVFHYGFYVVATVALHWIAGMKWHWQ